MDQINRYDPSLEVALSAVQTVILDRMPGDLTKIVYLSTLRNNNTGSYFHPRLSEIHGGHRVDCAMSLSHRRLFLQIVKAPVSQYVEELKLYMHFANLDIISAWRTLEPYHGTIPSNIPMFLREVYFHNIEMALLVLQSSAVDYVAGRS